MHLLDVKNENHGNQRRKTVEVLEKKVSLFKTILADPSRIIAEENDPVWMLHGNGRVFTK